MPHWGPDNEQRAFEWYAGRERSDLFVLVPVAQPDWRGWPSDSERHYFSAVMVTQGEGALLEWDEAAFEEAVSGDLRPIIAWSYADRPVFGQVVAGVAMLKRSFPEHGPIHPVVLVRPQRHPSNVDPVYREQGIEIVVVPNEVLA